MPQYWLKPLGTTEPPRPLADDWTVDHALPAFDLDTGPATIKKPPQMGKGDRVILHAVIHVRVFAEAEILDNPLWRPHPVWGERFPWVYPCRVTLWVPKVSDGIPTALIAPKRAFGRIQAGGEYANLTKGEYESMAAALEALPSLMRP